MPVCFDLAIIIVVQGISELSYTPYRISFIHLTRDEFKLECVQRNPARTGLVTGELCSERTVQKILVWYNSWWKNL